MLNLRFALVLLLAAGKGALADIPVGNVGAYYPQPGANIQNGNPPANPGTIQQWNGSPAAIQQPSTNSQSSYNPGTVQQWNKSPPVIQQLGTNAQNGYPSANPGTIQQWNATPSAVQQPGTNIQNSNTPANPGTIQQWNGSPSTIQQPNNYLPTNAGTVQQWNKPPAVIQQPGGNVPNGNTAVNPGATQQWNGSPPAIQQPGINIQNGNPSANPGTIQQPGTNIQNGNPLPNAGTIQQWTGSPAAIQQPATNTPNNYPPPNPGMIQQWNVPPTAIQSPGTSIQNSNPGMIQQWTGAHSAIQQPPTNPQPWNGAPSTVQQPVQYIPRTQPENAYNSEDYDGEQYDDNRLRLMLYPKKTITLNETNLRTWKINPATTPYSSNPVTEASEPFLSLRRFTDEETGNSEPEETSNSTKTNSTKRDHTQLFLGINVSDSMEFHLGQPINASQIITDSLTNITSTVVGSTPSKPDNPNVSAVNLTTGNDPSISKNTTQRSIPNKISKTSKSTLGDENLPLNGTTEAIEIEINDDTAYVDIETDSDYGDDDEGSDPQDDIPDVPDPNSYVIVLSGGKEKQGETRNITSVKPDMISDSLLYVLSNLTATSTMNVKQGKSILRRLHRQKTQINDVNTKINNIYELLKNQN